MGLEGLLTLAGLLVALYAIQPNTHKLGLKLRWRRTNWIVVVLVLLGFHYLQFYPFFKSIGWNPQWTLSRWNVSRQQISYLIVAIAVLVVWARMRSSRLSRGQIYIFRELVEELLRTGRHAEVMSLIELHLRQLKRIYDSDFPLVRLRSRIQPRDLHDLQFESFIKGSPPPAERRRLLRVSDSLRRWFADKLPTYDHHQAVAHEVLRRFLLSSESVSALVSMRPYLAHELLDMDFQETDGFLRLYFQAMLADPDSALCYEIKDNWESCSNDEYLVPGGNRTLRYFFSDAKVGKDLAVWRPVGSALLKELNRCGMDQAADPHNRPSEDFEGEGKWGTSLYFGLRFFDVMATAAIWQGIHHHMWVFYLGLMTERIVKNYRPTSGPNTSVVEFPVLYSNLLYSIFEVLGKWLSLIEKVPEVPEPVSLRHGVAVPEGRNVPEGSIITLGGCTRAVLSSSNLEPEFAQYLLDMVFRLMFDMHMYSCCDGRSQRVRDTFRSYVKALQATLIRGGRKLPPTNDREYRWRLMNAFCNHDKSSYVMSDYGLELCSQLESAFNPTRDLNRSRCAKASENTCTE